MAILISKHLIQEHEVNPIYEAFKKAGIRLECPYVFAAGTENAANILKELGFIVELEKRDNSLQATDMMKEQNSSPDPSQTVTGQRYVYPDCYMVYVAKALNIPINYLHFGQEITSITLKRDGGTVVVDVTKY